MSTYSIPFPFLRESEDFLSALRRNRPLSFFGGIIGILVLPAYFLLMGFDNRTILGINPWIKPAKFAISIWIFLWTMGWILNYLQEYPKFLDRIEKYFVVGMGVELFLITVQAARGVPSHFNQSTILNSIIYGVMGLFIYPVIPVAILIDRKFRNPIKGLDMRLKTAIRISLRIFVFASLVGSYMTAIFSHSVGVPDGGEGLPFLNWSKRDGDIRIAHFVGIHALQILPLFALLAVRKNWSEKTVKYAGVALAILTSGVFINALLGRPLL
ncbi:putative membrane protein [Leptospira inadai serovar Lyme str. 10]|uniref:Uncharacterized protein n=2 Tax=Leptospira inadai serovar Lyme TaxID=293084 RepID=A0ABX4YJG4_9LEPT|nr:hypothetical protein [Leptospira inadai]EQA35619.1 putative membrane protein [Leptospira inadai serovar Lyme str. 10]PNV75413.1 hypothetical protein BES34_009175 [Leptospira inadai serovar Lyme]